MKSILPIIALALIGCCSADNFRLPPFRVLDKNNDGVFTDKEAGQFMIDTARALTQVAGKKLFWAFGHLPFRHLISMRDEGKLTEENYRKFEEDFRRHAHDFLEYLKEESGQWQEEIEVKNHNIF